MFECLLVNSDDVFALCRMHPPDGAGGQLRVVVEYVSPSVAWRLAFAQADVVGRDLLDVCHPEDRATFLTALRAAHAGGASGGHVNYLHRNVAAGGGEVWCHTSGLVKGDALFVVCRDMRTLASVELALRTFTLATSHDMREPCNTILMAAAVLERRPCVAAHEEVADLVEAVRSACGLLLGIVGNVLTTPQVEAGLLAPQVGVFSPDSVVADVLQACRTGCAAAAARGGARITLEAAHDDALRTAVVEGDRHRVAQVRACVRHDCCAASRRVRRVAGGACGGGWARAAMGPLPAPAASLSHARHFVCSFISSAPLRPLPGTAKVVQNLVVRLLTRSALFLS
jgi:hypothetical protein